MVAGQRTRVPDKKHSKCKGPEACEGLAERVVVLELSEAGPAWSLTVDGRKLKSWAGAGSWL